MPITLNIATGSRVGEQTFTMTALGESSNSEISARADVRVELRGTLRADPDTIIFRQAQTGIRHSADVELADMLPDPGIQIAEIRVSNPQTMNVELKSGDGPSSIFGDSAAAKKRGRLRLSYTPGATEGRIQEMISIVPKNSGFPTLQVPVYSEMAKPPYRFSPNGLTIVGSGQATFRRQPFFISQRNVERLSVLRAPPGVTVDIGEPSTSGTPITISGAVSDIQPQGSEVVFQVNDDEVSFSIRKIESN
jgi:hypothetical protein